MADEEGTDWHKAFGFEEKPDLFLGRVRRMFVSHGISRHEGPGTADAGREFARPQPLYEYWDHRTEELEEVANRKGLEALAPVLCLSR